AGDASRTALYWEDESGASATHTFRDIQRAANRLSNALAGLGVGRGDRVALLLPQRPETAIAYMAIFQMGAIALPLSHLLGPEARAVRAARGPRQHPRLRALARFLPAGGRRVLVARRLGLGRRPVRRAAARLALRHPAARLSRQVRRGQGVLSDREVRDPEHV